MRSLPGTVGSVNQPRSVSDLRPHSVGGQRGQRQLQRSQREDHEALQQGSDAAGVLHLREVDGRIERHPRAGRRHPVPGQQLLRAVRVRGSRHSTRATASWRPAVWDIPIGKGRQVDISESGWRTRLVGGWQVGSILTLQSGFPITPNIGGSDRSGTGGGFDRPNATGVSPYLDNPTPTKWFNLAAFSVQPAGTYGNAGRNSWSGPGIVAFDFSLHKDFQRRRNSDWSSVGSCSTRPTIRCGERRTRMRIT